MLIVVGVLTLALGFIAVKMIIQALISYLVTRDARDYRRAEVGAGLLVFCMSLSEATHPLIDFLLRPQLHHLLHG